MPKLKIGAPVGGDTTEVEIKIFSEESESRLLQKINHHLEDRTILQIHYSTAMCASSSVYCTHSALVVVAK